MARQGTDVLFLDMLDVGRSLWTEQVMQTANKHPDNPLLRPSGDPDTLDSHRVFNGGVVLRDDGLFKAWYTSMNPIGDWFADGGMAWKRMTHLCYATSTDGIRWEKPNLGLYEFNGNKRNNGLDLAHSLSSKQRNYHGPIRAMLNPDQGEPSRKYLSVPPGFVSADGLRWQPQPVSFNCPGPKPKWVDFHSVVHDPLAPASRRWKAYGCMCPNEQPVRRTVCYAYSVDGKTWTQHPENPILQPETSSSWDKVHDVGVSKYKGHYVMVYQAGDGYDQHLELAVSRDGEHFVRVHDGQSIIDQGKGDAFDRGLFLPTRPLVLEDEIRLYAIAVDLRGREESSGQRDDGGLEVMDIYDAVHAALRKHPQETDSDCINIIGWSGGGGNVFSAVTRMPDLFSNAAAFYGITDYGYWAKTSFKGVLEPNIGGTPQEVPDRYAARNSLLGVINNAYTNFHFFWDEKETICPVWMDTEYRRIAGELGYRNITAHESKETDKFRWLHSGGDRASAVESERICMPLFTQRNNPAPRLAPVGRLMVLGYLMTRQFGTMFGQGNDAVVQLDYELAKDEYRFVFQLESSDPSVRGWLQVTDRMASEVVAISQNGKPHEWETMPDGHARIRDINPNAKLTICFAKAGNKEE